MYIFSNDTMLVFISQEDVTSEEVAYLCNGIAETFSCFVHAGWAQPILRV